MHGNHLILFFFVFAFLFRSSFKSFFGSFKLLPLVKKSFFLFYNDFPFKNGIAAAHLHGNKSYSLHFTLLSGVASVYM